MLSCSSLIQGGVLSACGALFIMLFVVFNEKCGGNRIRKTLIVLCILIILAGGCSAYVGIEKSGCEKDSK
jgi:hypothetical protein